ncbi:MAG: 50S ribosomal protein L4 [Candidatus Omnitrophica bacterium]|nr:50S ribosomal protein L4 [Candidatus Omnitrophota bacterium]
MSAKATPKPRKKSLKSAKKTVSKETRELNLAVLNTQGKKVEEVDIDATVFDGIINMSLMHQAVVIYLSNQRKGLACTKTRGDVRGGGKKPWRQKGTGRARFGSSRNPVWRGGGVAFGPKPHSYYKDLPKKMKTLAFKSALNAKLRDKELILLDELKLESHKAKKFAGIVGKLKLDKEKVCFVVKNLENNLKLATRNIEKVEIASAASVHTIEILDCSKLVLTKSALRTIEERIKKCLA